MRVDERYDYRDTTKTWLHNLAEQGLGWHVTPFTYKSAGRRKDGKYAVSILDHVYSTPDILAEMKVLPDSSSDHYPVLAHMYLRHGPGQQLPPPHRPRLPRITIRNFSPDAVDYEGMAAMLGQAPVPAPPVDRSAEEVLDDLYSVINPMIEKFVPKKEIKVRKSGPPLKIQADTRRIMKLRDEARAQNNMGQFRSLRNHAVKLLKRDRMKSLLKVMSSATDRQATAWRLANSILKPERQLPILRKTNSNQESANLLNSFYIEKIDKLRSQLPNDEKEKKKHSDDDDCNGMFNLHTVGDAAIKRAIKRMSNSKAAGTDGIPAAFWKACPDPIVAMVRNFVNVSILQGSVPTSLKTAVIHPRLKKGKDPLDPASWRPVALLPTLSKILERVIF